MCLVHCQKLERIISHLSGSAKLSYPFFQNTESSPCTTRFLWFLRKCDSLSLSVRTQEVSIYSPRSHTITCTTFSIRCSVKCYHVIVLSRKALSGRNTQQNTNTLRQMLNIPRSPDELKAHVSFKDKTASSSKIFSYAT